MLSLLKNHPFAIEAYFEYSITLTFAFLKEDLKHLIPQCLTLDTYKDKWAFIAVAIVQTNGLRPKGLPEFMGNDFLLIGYRIFVRYQNRKGKNLRGLYILKSETDSKKMEIIGNLFTHYKFSTTDININTLKSHSAISSEKSRFHFTYKMNGETINLPDNSPFSEWSEARRFSGPLPFTFSLNGEKNKVSIVEGVRQNWKPIPISILDYKFPFFEQLKIGVPILANAFIVKNIPYYWKKGNQELWQQ